MKGIKFNFNKTKNKLMWVKITKTIFGLGLKEAKDAVDSGEYFYNLDHLSDRNEAIHIYDSITRQIVELTEADYSNIVEFIWQNNEFNSQNIQEIQQIVELNVVKVGSVYIITEEEYESLKESKDTLKNQTNLLNNMQDILNQILIKNE